MKNIILLFIALIPFVSFAQSGTVKYEETFKFKIDKMDVNIEGVDSESILSMLPDEQKNQTVLYYKNNESVYKAIPVEKATNQTPTSGLVIQMETPQTYIYYDSENNSTLTKTKFFDRDFIITSEDEETKWKITTEQKMIQDYLCIKATTMDEDSSEVVVWFTPQVQVDAAPGGIKDVPGLVLEAQMEDGKLTIVATDIDLENTKEEEIVAPEKGKKVTQDKFNKIQEKKMKEMEEQFNSEGDGMMIIISD